MPNTKTAWFLAWGLSALMTVGTTGSALAESPDQTKDVSVDSTFVPDPITGSLPGTPKRNVAKIKKQQSQAIRDTTPLAGNSSDYGLYTVAASLLAYNDELAPREDYLAHDAEGVRIFRFAGTTKYWDHPVAQAQWGLKNLASYRTTSDKFYLNRAIAQAQRNIERHTETPDGAWWYAYDFDAARCAESPPMLAPWYSGMAQGQLLSLFVRLYEYTNDAKWKQAADHTFVSLTLAPDETAPWGSWVDPDGYRWLEEYPQPTESGERVMNGHIFAMYGVYDYWRVTRSAEAVQVFDAAAVTVTHYLPKSIRLTNWASKYSLGCQHPHTGYHVVHTGQTLRLYQITHAGVFANLSSMLRSDYPEIEVKGTVRFKAGTHVEYKFDANGKILASKTLKLTAASNAPTDKRTRVRGHGVFYLITAGALRGYLVAEQFPNRVLLGKTVEQRYYPTRTLAFKPGRYTAYAYDKFGNQIASRVASYSKAVTAPLAATAVVNGRLSYLVTKGYFKGWWMPSTSGLTIKP